MMRLSVKALSIACGIVWGAAILCVGLLHLADPNYGANFLQVTNSVYPWFHNTTTIQSVVIGTVEAFIDGAISGLVLALLYNSFARMRSEAQHGKGQEARTV